MEKLDDANHETNEEFIDIVDEFSHKKKRHKKKKDMSNCRCKPELDTFNRTMLKDENFKAHAHMLRHEKYAGEFDDDEESKELINTLMKKSMLQIA